MGALRKGAAAAHKAVGHAAAAQRLGADGEPSEVLAKLKGSWQARWCRDADARERPCAEFTALRQAALLSRFLPSGRVTGVVEKQRNGAHLEPARASSRGS